MFFEKLNILSLFKTISKKRIGGLLMPSKEKLLSLLNARQLRQLAKDSNVKLIIKEESGFIRKTVKTRKARTLEEIRDILLSSRKITKHNLRLAIARKKPEPIIKNPKIEKTSSKKGRDRMKGHEFEDRAARWAKRYFNAEEVETRVLRRGYTQKRTYEIDIRVDDGDDNIWIECKNLKQTVKRDFIDKYVRRFNDVNKAYGKGLSQEDYDFGYLAIVSTTKFDIGAIGKANEDDVACFYYDGKKFNFVNEDEIDWYY